MPTGMLLRRIKEFAIMILAGVDAEEKLKILTWGGWKFGSGASVNTLPTSSGKGGR
jgi:hypothetical protein